jgi:hypothetical protein
MRKSSFNGKREFKQLAKKLSFLLEKGWDKKSAQVRILLSKIKTLVLKERYSKRFVRRVLGASVVLLGLGFLQPVNAQTVFASGSLNPFNLTTTAYISSPEAADLDNDGDLDLIVGEIGGNIQYFQNTGSGTTPNFSTKLTNPFGLISTNTISIPTAADLDGDGDIDILVSDYDSVSSISNFKYFQNTGTASNPSFAAPVTNPFGLPPLTNNLFFRFPDLADIDGDGDYDLMTASYNNSQSSFEFKYYENTGSNTNPSFGVAQVNPFNLMVPTGYQYLGYFDIADLDSDGDPDLIFGEYYSSDFKYYENTGTSTAPNFAANVTNPFSLSSPITLDTTFYLNAPLMADLDNDGDLDILTGTYYGNFIYYENLKPVGINEIEKHNIKLYPNPVSDVLKLESDVEIQSLSVLDITGKVITTFNKPNNMVSLKEIPNGIYIIRVDLKNEESVYTRIVKQ